MTKGRRALQIAVLALGLASGWFWGRWYLAALDLQQARWLECRPEALPALRRAVRRAPRWGFAHQELASARLLIGDLAGTVSSLSTASRTYRDYTTERLWGWALEQQGRLEEALEHYRLGLAYHPSSALLRRRTVSVLAALAGQEIQRAMNAPAGRPYRGTRIDPTPLARAGVLLAEAESAAGSDVELQGEVLEGRGRLGLLQGDLETARAVLAERIRLAPQKLDPLSSRWALEESFEPGRERALLRRQLQLGPLAPADARQLAFELDARVAEFADDPGLHAYLLGLAQLRAGDPAGRETLARVPAGSPFAAEAGRLQEGGLAASALDAGRQLYAAR